MPQTPRRWFCFSSKRSLRFDLSRRIDAVANAFTLARLHRGSGQVIPPAVEPSAFAGELRAAAVA
jgi:hypothetical protein